MQNKIDRPMSEKLNPKDKVLLMRDEGDGNNLKVVKGIDKKGKIDALDPIKAKETDFLVIDKHADPLENFFKNFLNQTKNPSHTGFYAISVDMLDKVLTLSDKDLEKYRVNPNDFIEQKNEKQESKKEEVEPTKIEKDMKTEKEVKAEPTKEVTEEQKTEFKAMDINRIPDSEYQVWYQTREYYWRT